MNKRNPFAPVGFKQHVPRFYTLKGWLTWYGLACGYIEQKTADNVQTELWHDGPCLHVRQHDFNTGKRVFWDCFDGQNKLQEARQRFLAA